MILYGSLSYHLPTFHLREVYKLEARKINAIIQRHYTIDLLHNLEMVEEFLEKTKSSTAAYPCLFRNEDEV